MSKLTRKRFDRKVRIPTGVEVRERFNYYKGVFEITVSTPNKNDEK